MEFRCSRNERLRNEAQHVRIDARCILQARPWQGAGDG